MFKQHLCANAKRAEPSGKNKVRLLEDKPVLYTSIADIHNRVELIYDTVKNNQYKPEYHNINGGFKERNKVETKGGQ